VLFFGATITQAVTYVQTCHSDGWFVILVVILTLILDLLHIVLVTHGTYIYVVRNMGNLNDLGAIPWSLLSLTLVTCTCVAVVRLLFVRRIWYLSKRNYVVTGIPVVLSLGSLIVAICAGVRVLSLPTFNQVERVPWIVYATTGSDVVADVAIAGTLWYYLSRTPSGYEGTSNLLHTLTRCIIGTGAVTVIWDVMEIVMFATLRDTLLFTIFFLSLSNLYTNALLGSLNARLLMRQELEHSPTYFKYPEHNGPRGRAQIACEGSSHSIDDSMELRASHSKVVTLEMGNALVPDNASSTQYSEKINHLY